MAEMLYTSTDLRAAIIKLFSTPRGRRVAVIGFVAEGAESYLPKPHGIELYCWPKAGGTNPNTLRLLDARGVRIHFVDKLHMKVYWAEARGAIITSANLSTNALGAGDLKETGVLLDSKEVDIERIISGVRSREMTGRELRALDREHDQYFARNPVDGGPSTDAVTFQEWRGSTAPREWKLGWWEEQVPTATAVKEMIKDEYGISGGPYWSLGASKRAFVPSDWVLSFRLVERRATKIKWMYVDHVVPLPRNDKEYDKERPCDAVQVWPLKRYTTPPFNIDPGFRSAFASAVEQSKVEIESGSLMTPALRLTNLVAKEYLAKKRRPSSSK